MACTTVEELNTLIRKKRGLKLPHKDATDRDLFVGDYVAYIARNGQHFGIVTGSSAKQIRIQPLMYVFTDKEMFTLRPWGPDKGKPESPKSKPAWQVVKIEKTQETYW